MNEKKSKRKIILNLLVAILVIGVSFAAGYLLFIIFYDGEASQVLEYAGIEREKIEGTDYFVTNNQDWNEALSRLSQSRIGEILDADPSDLDTIKALGEEIHAIMGTIDEAVNQFYIDSPDADTATLEEHFNLYKNLSGLRVYDRYINGILQYNGIDYIEFYEKPRELSAKDGKLVLEYIEPANFGLHKYYRALKESNTFEPLVEAINAKFSFERNHSIVFEELNVISAWYAPDSQNIYIAYELMDSIFSSLHETGMNSVNETEEMLVDSIAYILIHEIGHALIDIYRLQFIGKEEDVVDQLAVILMVELLGNDAENLIETLYPAPTFFYITMLENSRYIEEIRANTRQSPNGKVPIEFNDPKPLYADEHSLDYQRVVDMETLIYGINPFDAEFMLNLTREELRFTRGAINNAPDIYLDTSNFWFNALFPYMK